ncbi:Nif3-like dinuclear metal center hexameric protein [Filifactor villosus]|uniref:GTP cyclohydrolase 1 type 2 homolog n=1 Tax=Filifactor villosus TaxID=29374 RepID=A0ABV9QLX9_9FIRM
MLLRELVEKLDALTRVESCYSWDNSGLIIGDLNKDINRILLCLELTDEVLEEARGLNVQLIISHHPVIFSPTKRFVREIERGNLVYDLIASSIASYTAHTNFDMLEGGLNDYVLNLLGVGERRELYDGEDRPIGRVFSLPEPVKVSEFAKRIKETLDLPEIRIVAKSDRYVKKIGIVTGSGMDVLLNAQERLFELFLTGDVKYHQALDAMNKGYCVIDGGHYGTEKLFSEAMFTLVDGYLDGVEIIKSKVNVNPFQYLE